MIKIIYFPLLDLFFVCILPESNLYNSTCLCLREALKQPEIDEHNCEAICKNLVSWWENAAVQNEVSLISVN